MYGLANGTAYTFTVTAVSAAGSGPASSPSAAVTPTWTPGEFHAVTPHRLLDTRSGGSPLGAGGVTTLTVTGGLPAGTTAVTLSVTVDRETGPSYLTVWPAGTPRPIASNLNWPGTGAVPNLVQVKVGAGGRVSFYNNLASTDLVVDLVGYFAPPGGTGGQRFVALRTPSRVVDTSATPLGAGETRTVTLAGTNGVPAGATAVVANLTGADATATTYLTAWQDGVARPTASNLNLTAGGTRAVGAVIPLTANKAQLYNNRGRTKVLVDVTGYYVPVSGSSGRFSGMAPSRVVDTRYGTGGHKGVLGQGETMTVAMLGQGGLPSSGVAAVAINVTVVQPTAPNTYVTAWPAGQARPGTSTLNAGGRIDVANLAIVPVGSGGAVSFYNNVGSVHLVVDVVGWYAG